MRTVLFAGLMLSALLILPQSLPAQAQNVMEGVEFRTTPPRLRWCGQPVERIEAEVRWDVTALGAESVVIYLDEAGGKVFHAGAAEGRRRTGQWVTDGMKFVLFLPEREQVAAEYTFRLLPCNTREYPG